MRHAMRRAFLCTLIYTAWGLLPTIPNLAADRLAADMIIVLDGQPRATIVVAKDAADPINQKIQMAAEELQAYVEKISGAKLPIVDDGQSPAGPLIFVGRSRLSDAMGVDVPAGLSPARRDEGFVIVGQGDRLLLAGNDDGPYHGTEYAVYDFLRSLGVRWYMPGEFGEIVPQQKTIRVVEQQILEKPDFVMRNWWLHALPELAAQEARWKLRNKMNPEPMFAICGDSSVRAIVAPEELRKEKPELFALNEDGTRNPYLPNLTQPRGGPNRRGDHQGLSAQEPRSQFLRFRPGRRIASRLQPRNAQAQPGICDTRRAARRARRGEHHRGMADVRQPGGG